MKITYYTINKRKFANKNVGHYNSELKIYYIEKYKTIFKFNKVLFDDEKRNCGFVESNEEEIKQFKLIEELNKL
jgi:hypothetical protein